VIADSDVSHASMPTPVLEPLETHAEWRARDIADRDLWTYRLTAADIRELEAVEIQASLPFRWRAGSRRGIPRTPPPGVTWWYYRRSGTLGDV